MERKSLQDLLSEDGRISGRILSLLKAGASKEEIKKDVIDDVFSLLKAIPDVSQTVNIEDNSKVYDLFNRWSNYAAYHREIVPTEYAPVDTPISFKDEAKRVTKRVIVGTVVGNSANKTASVEVTRRVSDKRTGKQITKTKRYAVHDEGNSCRVGDVVIALEGRPISKTKRHTLYVQIGRNERQADQFIRKRKQYRGISLVS